jgi:hypothetical protein
MVCVRKRSAERRSVCCGAQLLFFRKEPGIVRVFRHGGEAHGHAAEASTVVHGRAQRAEFVGPDLDFTHAGPESGLFGHVVHNAAGAAVAKEQGLRAADHLHSLQEEIVAAAPMRQESVAANHAGPRGHAAEDQTGLAVVVAGPAEALAGCSGIGAAKARRTIFREHRFYIGGADVLHEGLGEDVRRDWHGLQVGAEPRNGVRIEGAIGIGGV